MNPLDTAQVGTTTLNVTRLGLGGAPLGGLLTDVEIQTALSTVARGHELGIRYFDTAPLYGQGPNVLFQAGSAAAATRAHAYSH